MKKLKRIKLLESYSLCESLKNSLLKLKRVEEYRKLSNNTALYRYRFNSTYYSPGIFPFPSGFYFRFFYQILCQNIFEINLTLIDDVKHFPLVHNEESSKATIAIALSYQWDISE